MKKTIEVGCATALVVIAYFIGYELGNLMLIVMET